MNFSLLPNTTVTLRTATGLCEIAPAAQAASGLEQGQAALRRCHRAVQVPRLPSMGRVLFGVPAVPGDFLLGRHALEEARRRRRVHHIALGSSVPRGIAVGLEWYFDREPVRLCWKLREVV